MDTSKEYIEMCAAAKKLLPDHTPEIGDLYYDPILGIDFDKLTLEDLVVHLGDEWMGEMFRPWCNYCEDDIEYRSAIERSIRLLRQDQLQDMLDVDYTDLVCLIYDAYEFSDYPNISDFETMERLW